MTDGIDTSPLDELADKLDGLATSQLVEVERAGLRAVAKYGGAALRSVTPVSPGPFGATSLAKGAMKKAARGKVVAGEGDRGPAAVLGFGKLGLFAARVDGGTSEAAANPFIRTLQDAPAFLEKCQEQFYAAAEAKAEEILSASDNLRS